MQRLVEYKNVWKITVHVRRAVIYLLLFLFTQLTFQSIAQNIFQYDEISVFLNVQNVGGAEIPALIAGKELYLPITDLFDFLQIKNIVSPDFDSISGFFINPTALYLVNRSDNSVTFMDKKYSLASGSLIMTESNLYLHSSYFGQIFGLTCSFNFRTLSVNLISNLELPIIREMRQEQLRSNLGSLTGVRKADTTYQRDIPFFHFGMADWSVISTQEFQNNVNTRLNLALGGIFAWGQTDISLYYNSNEAIEMEQQLFLWKYVNNKNKYLRQSMAGTLPILSIATLYAPVLGLRFTNTPTTFRRSFGTYTLSDYTQPGWIVELYVNNVLVNYVKADASGFFSFEVPLVYGNSNVSLRYYGPWGEEKVREEKIVVPFNFLPAGEFEYNVAGGMVEDSSNSGFVHANAGYGITRNLTVGGGVEYLSSVNSGPMMPFLNLSAQLVNGLLFSGKYTFGVGGQAVLTYRRPSNLLFELNYTRYEPGQTAVNFYYLEDRKLMVSIPFRGKKYSAYTKLTFDNYVMPVSNYSTAEWLISATFLGISSNLTTYGLFQAEVDPSIYSNLAFSFQLPYGFILTPQTQFNYSKNAFISAKCGLEKRIFKQGYASVTYEDIFKNNIQILQFGLRYDFSFAQVGFSVWNTDGRTSMVESARGSIMFDANSDYVGTSIRNSVGKGGMVISTFLDLNCNGLRDAGEPRVLGPGVQVNGGRIKIDSKDTVVRVFDLEPYTNYFVELDQSGFDNIAWRIKNHTLSVAIEPNMFRQIEVPVEVLGEVTGKVFNSAGTGQGRMIISIENEIGTTIARTLTEPDGYFSYLGLKPGNYQVKMDTLQLQKLKLVAAPLSISVKINQQYDEAIIEGLKFFLHPEKNDSLDRSLPQNGVNSTQTDNKHQPENPDYFNQLLGANYAVQFGAFQSFENAEKIKSEIVSKQNLTVEIIYDDTFYKVVVIGIESKQEAINLHKKAKKIGFKDTFIVSPE